MLEKHPRPDFIMTILTTYKDRTCGLCGSLDHIMVKATLTKPKRQPHRNDVHCLYEIKYVLRFRSKGRWWLTYKEMSVVTHCRSLNTYVRNPESK